MTEEISDFIKSQRVSVFAIEMSDGSSHVSTVHFAHTENPLLFIFETDRSYRKSEPLLQKETSRASLVIGWEEGSNSKTFQLDGDARVLKDDEQHLIEAYLAKFPEKTEKASDPENLFFVFVPTWWRFTDWFRPEGKMIITSHGKVTT